MKNKKRIKTILFRIIFIVILLAILIFYSFKAYKKYLYYRPLKVMNKFMEATINNDPDAIEACCYPEFYSRIKGPALSDAAMLDEYRKNGAKVSYMIAEVDTGTIDDGKKLSLIKRWNIRDYRIAGMDNNVDFDINRWTATSFITVFVNIDTPGNNEGQYCYFMKYYLVEIDNNWYVLNTYENEQRNYEWELDTFIAFNLLDY